MDIMKRGMEVDNHSMRVTEDSRPWQGPPGCDAEVRKDKVEKMQSQNYQVNSSAVAEAILERLLAGRAVPKRPN
ncbi:MAG: hypothetical protein QOF76_3831 [Solirubrobacteraceae bacterium]|jgi:hypothetical protein|nr:hypothetical protein [Solirubrobacteraceae bacterium]